MAQSSTPKKRPGTGWERARKTPQRKIRAKQAENPRNEARNRFRSERFQNRARPVEDRVAAKLDLAAGNKKGAGSPSPLFRFSNCGYRLNMYGMPERSLMQRRCGAIREIPANQHPSRAAAKLPVPALQQWSIHRSANIGCRRTAGTRWLSRSQWNWMKIGRAHV